MSEIAIFSTTLDAPTYSGVAEKLARWGHEPWVYNADKVCDGSDRLCLSIDGSRGLSLSYNGVEHELASIQSAWFRHPHILNLNIDDKSREMCIEKEIEALQESPWQHVPDKAWLNHPQKMKMAQAKIAQLALAQEVGFTVPDTVVTNEWRYIDQHLPDDSIIVKMSRGLMYEENMAKVLYATILDANNRSALIDKNPFPGIYQSYKSKEREWRLTVVGDDIFSAAIYTDSDAKDDWRRHQLTSRVAFKNEPPPDAESKMCIEFLQKQDLNYGAFDLVEGDEGEITFLECNTNGQFKWLEDKLDLQISDAVANLLAKLATNPGYTGQASG